MTAEISFSLLKTDKQDEMNMDDNIYFNKHA